MKFVPRFLRRKPRPRFHPVTPELPMAPHAEFRASAFPAAGPAPWLDRPDALAAIERKLARGEISAREAALARDWTADGVVVLERFFESARLDAVWGAYERALEAQAVTPDAEPTAADPLPGRTLNAHFEISAVDELLRDPPVVELVSMLLGAQALPFQTIVGHKGSEQRPHSDAIHMTTYPLGYLAAAWIAFEDITADAGPLVYYPGSHRLPYVFSDDVGISAHDFRDLGYRTYHERYEPRIVELIEASGLEPRYFTPRKGDLLLWYANLLRRVSPRTRRDAARRALVCHYFARGCVTYHDLADSPSHLFAARS